MSYYLGQIFCSLMFKQHLLNVYKSLLLKIFPEFIELSCNLVKVKWNKFDRAYQYKKIAYICFLYKNSSFRCHMMKSVAQNKNRWALQESKIYNNQNVD